MTNLRTSWAVPNDANMLNLKVAERVGFGKGDTDDSKGLIGANGKPVMTYYLSRMFHQLLTGA